MLAALLQQGLCRRRSALCACKHHCFTSDLRAELLNFLNHPNLRLPDSDISSPTFNQILAARDPRQVQFALKFLF